MNFWFLALESFLVLSGSSIAGCLCISSKCSRRYDMAISDLEYLDFDKFVLSFDSQLENIEENICLSRFATKLPRCVACGSLCPSAASRVSLEVSASAAPRHPKKDLFERFDSVNLALFA